MEGSLAGGGFLSATFLLVRSEEGSDASNDLVSEGGGRGESSHRGTPIPHSLTPQAISSREDVAGRRAPIGGTPLPHSLFDTLNQTGSGGAFGNLTAGGGGRLGSPQR
ncbi:hypothetical protein CDL15_Pgr026084 [Punica granatum]|uniref:Uncharacterized protein n=1 Tax=Punica granatum TaxID=22663 RepID=A0A218WBI2_PUNGR|nr:hypothetical protein CDL15_Pgr026084 [Punica granatum]PKI34895.1 hypothetical protein CRG98_044741 [Punica granatum]